MTQKFLRIKKGFWLSLEKLVGIEMNDERKEIEFFYVGGSFRFKSYELDLEQIFKNLEEIDVRKNEQLFRKKDGT